MPLGDNDAADRVWCEGNKVHYCEPGDPFPGGKGRAYHPFAKEVPDSQKDGYPGGDTVRNHCPVCGTTWTQEFPQ